MKNRQLELLRSQHQFLCCLLRVRSNLLIYSNDCMSYDSRDVLIVVLKRDRFAYRLITPSSAVEMCSYFSNTRSMIKLAN